MNINFNRRRCLKLLEKQNFFIKIIGHSLKKNQKSIGSYSLMEYIWKIKLGITARRSTIH